MLSKLKQYALAIVAGAVALAYFLGIKKGKQNEKAHQTNTLLANIQRADKARHTLADNPDAVRRLHNKYRRK
ncbi:MAG: hypothetical protein IKP24_01900 [Alphaproteobacteria bacterium]|nr:hypothetical protein [Alphaproteobacteria bacterium]